MMLIEMDFTTKRASIACGEYLVGVTEAGRVMPWKRGQFGVVLCR